MAGLMEEFGLSKENPNKEKSLLDEFNLRGQPKPEQGPPMPPVPEPTLVDRAMDVGAGVAEGVGSLTEGLADAVINVPRRVGRGINEAIDAVTGEENTIQNRLNIPNIEAKGALTGVKDKTWGDQSLYEMGTALPGAVAGAIPAARGMQGANAVYRWLTAGAAANAGAAVTQDPDIDPLITGDRAAFELIDFLPEGMSETEGGRLLENMVDNVVVGLPLDATLLGLGSMTKYVGGVLGKIKNYAFTNDEKLNRDIAMEIGEAIFRRDTSNMSMSEKAWREKVLEYVRQPANQAGTFDLSKVDAENLDPVEVKRTLFNIRRKMIAEEIQDVLANPNLSESKKKAIINEKQRLSSALLDEQNNVKKIFTGETERALNRPSEVMQESMDDVYEGRGGFEATEQARDDIIGEAELDAGLPEARTSLRTTEGALGDYEVAIQDAIDNGGVVKAQLDQALTNSQMNTIKGPTESANEVVDRLFMAFEGLDGERQRLFDEISPSAKGNSAHVLEYMKNNGQSSLTQIMKAVQDAGDNFKALDTIGRTQVQELINKQGPSDALVGLRKALTDDQIGFLDDTNKAAQKKALDFYKKKMTIWNDNNVLRGVKEAYQDRFLSSTPDLQKEQARNVVQSGLQNLDSTTSSTLDTMIGDSGITAQLRSEAGGRSAKPLERTALANTQKELDEALTSTTEFDEKTLFKVQNQYRKIAPLLEQTNPKLLKSMEDLFTSMRTMGGNKVQAQKKIKELTKKIDEAEKAIQQGVLKDFYDKEAIKQPQVIFKSILSDETDRATQIANHARNADTMDGVIAGVSKALKDTLYGANTVGGESLARKPRLEKFAELSDPNSTLSNNLKQFYDADAMKVINDLARVIYQENSAATEQSKELVSGAAPRVQAQFATNQVITWIFGILNPIAARVRTVTRDVINKMDPQDRVYAALDDLIANPDEWADIMATVKVKDFEQKTLEAVLLRQLVRAGAITEEEATLHSAEER